MLYWESTAQNNDLNKCITNNITKQLNVVIIIINTKMLRVFL